MQSEISENAIKIHAQLLGFTPLTFNEICSLATDISQEDIKNVINELISRNLIISIKSEKPEILPHYVAIPPFNLIFEFFKTIHKDSIDKQNQFQEIISNSIKKIFEENNPIKMDSSINQIQKTVDVFTKDLESNNKNVSKLVKKIEDLNQISKILMELKEILFGIHNQFSDLHKRIKAISQAQFGNLIKILSTVKNNLKVKLQETDLGKNNQTILKMIEDVFGEEFQKMVDEFTVTIIGLIDLEFNKTLEPIYKLVNVSLKEKIIEPINNCVAIALNSHKEIINSYSNLTNNFITKINDVGKLVIDNKEMLLENVQNLENSILESLNNNLKEIISQIMELFAPLENSIKEVEKIIAEKKIIINNVWLIKNDLRIREEMENVLTNSKSEISLIIPNVENFLQIEQIKTVEESVKLKIAASETPEQKLVQSLLKLKNVEYRTLKNDNLVAIKGDDNCFIIGNLLKDSDDLLNNNIGLGTNFKPLIDLLNPIIENSWSIAKPPPEPEPQPEAISQPENTTKI
ncbi:MAG TPA: hypothetical protein VGB37_01790, partial [Candidatus Lokiarchaeia archaeon]